MGTAARLLDERRKEIINGRVVMMSPARLDHLQVSGNLYRFFGNYLQGKTCRVFPDGAKVELSEKDQFIPDLVIVCDPSKLQGTKIVGAPDLVVEILSPTTANNDRIYKKQIYEAHGVKEYWIISIETRTVEVYQLQDGELKPGAIYLHPLRFSGSAGAADAKRFASPSAEIRCSLFPDLFIPLKMIFDLVE